jgi:hypothetical protein
LEMKVCIASKSFHVLYYCCWKLETLQTYSTIRTSKLFRVNNLHAFTLYMITGPRRISSPRARRRCHESAALHARTVQEEPSSATATRHVTVRPSDPRTALAWRSRLHGRPFGSRQGQHMVKLGSYRTPDATSQR